MTEQCCAPASAATETCTPENLHSCGVKTQPFTLAAGNTFVRGQVVEFDGSEIIPLATAANAFGIIAVDVDTTAGAQEMAIYVGGEFNEDALDYGAADAATTRGPLRDRGIHIRKFGGVA